MFQFDNRGHRFAAHIFYGVLIAQPVRPLDGVVHMPAPVVFAHITQRGGNTALRGDRMTPGREHFGNARRFQAFFGHAKRRAKTSATGANDHHIISVVNYFV